MIILNSKSDYPALEAQVLLAHVLDRPRSWILAHSEYSLTDAEDILLKKTLFKLISGEPLPYITHHQEFYGLDFIVSNDVLIPRPETELIVEQALLWLNRHSSKKSVLELGTGSGCISISLAYHNRELNIISTDISRSALNIARKNAQIHNVQEQVKFIQCNLSDPIRCRFDMVCANLPYIPTSDLEHLKVAQFEPRIALDGGRDGLFYIYNLINNLSQLLSPTGVAWLEIEENQKHQVLSYTQEHFPAGNIQVIDDLGQHPRVLRIDYFEN